MQKQTISPFRDNLEYLYEQLERIKLLLRLEVLRFRSRNSQAGENQFQGLYISDREIDQITSSSSAREESGEATPACREILDRIRRKAKEIEERREETARLGTRLRLDELQHQFDLGDTELDIILVCILPELELEYSKIYAYLQDNVTKKLPGVDFILKLLCDTEERRLNGRTLFSEPSTLIKYRIIRIMDEQGQSFSPLPGHAVCLDERIIDYLLGKNSPEQNAACCTSISNSSKSLDDLLLPDDIRKRLLNLVQVVDDINPVLYFNGERGSGKKTTAEALCKMLNKPLLNIDSEKLVKTTENAGSMISVIFREGRLQQAALYFENIELITAEERTNSIIWQDVIKGISEYRDWVFLASDTKLPAGDGLFRKPVFSLEFPALTPAVRQSLWERNMDNAISLAGDVDLAEIAYRFRLNGDQIQAAAASLLTAANIWNEKKGEIAKRDIYFACRRQSETKLSALAKKIEPKYQWNDIVLPPDHMQQLQELCSFVKYHNTVYNRWGFDKKLSLGKGLNALFAGPSGTGKTMAAEILAGQLGLDLFKVNLSTIVSKYIGETEKNLESIFKEGQSANAILFFDEADALFGKRSEVRDSHDRYANIEVAYLLQRMEEYEGAVILATNMRKNMDDAFIRRLHSTIDCPLPEEADRKKIWQNVFPEQSPLDNDIDFDFLARQFKISGGNIKNIALGAAFMAASDGKTINMANLIRATRREYQKMGKLCTQGDFAQFFELVNY